MYRHRGEDGCNKGYHDYHAHGAAGQTQWRQKNFHQCVWQGNVGDLESQHMQAWTEGEYCEEGQRGKPEAATWQLHTFANNREVGDEAAHCEPEMDARLVYVAGQTRPVGMGESIEAPMTTWNEQRQEIKGVDPRLMDSMQRVVGVEGNEGNNERQSDGADHG